MDSLDIMDSRDSDFSNSGSYPPSSGNFPSGNYPSSDFEYQKHLVEVDERLSCAVCLCRFTEPRLLNCNHTFCKHCLEEVLAKRSVDQDNPLGAYEIQCPRCRKITRLGHGGIETLPRNYDLELVVDAMPPEPAVEPKMLARQQSVPICPIHKGELAFFCKTDNSLVCADCLVETHKHHDFYRAGDVYHDEKEKFYEGYFEMLEKERQKFMLALDDVSHAVSSLRRKGEQTVENIQLHFQTLRESLIQREDELVMKTQKIVALKVNKLLEQEKQLKEIHEGLDSEFMHCRRVMESNPVEFLYEKDKLADKAKAVINRARHVERAPTELASQGPYWHHPSTALSDSESKSGVFCDPVAAMYTAVGSGLTKAFVGKEATFRVEARDKYGNKSFMKGAVPNVTITGPNKGDKISYKVDQSVPGEYLVTYSPSVVGWHSISIKVNNELIKEPLHKVIVFGSKDYLSISQPKTRIDKSRLNFDPPVATMRGVCVLPNGWVVFVDSSCLRVIDELTGKAHQTIGNYGNNPGQFSSPYGLTLTTQNHLFVTDISNHRVQRFAPDGNFRFRYVSLFGTQGTNKQCFDSPEGIAALGDDRVFVADKGNNRIMVISQKNMKYQAVFGKRGERPGYFNHPRDVFVTPSNFLLVSDSGNKRIQALSLEGKIITMFGGYNCIIFKPRTPSFIAMDADGFILVTYKESGLVTVLTPQADKPVCELNNNFLKAPFGIQVDKQGTLVITDSTYCHMLCF